MQLRQLTVNNVNSVINACRILEAQYVTSPTGIVQAAPNSTAETLNRAAQCVLDSLNSMNDDAFAELQALVWHGRDGQDFMSLLHFSRGDVNGTSRQYLHQKGRLREHLETGLFNSRAVLVP